MQRFGKTELLQIRETYGVSAAVVTLPLQIVMGLTPFPSDLFSIANGALYGLWIGTLLSWFGWWIAAMLQFAIGRRARMDFELDAEAERVPGWLRRFPVGHPVYLIFVRLVPYLGMHMGSLVPGAAGVPWPRFVWCSAIGTFPGSLIMTAVGAGLVRW